MSEVPIQHPHDKFFRAAFSHPEAARGVFEAYLPLEVASACDFSSIRLASGHFVDEKLNRSESDLLYEVQLGGK